MSVKERMLDSITSRIIVFFQTNKAGSMLNRNDGAIAAEDFISDLFNLVRDHEKPGYICTKKLKSNYPGIDVLSTTKKEGIQVTVQTTRSKVTTTFSKIPKLAQNTDYSRIIFVVQDTTLSNTLKRFPTSYEGYTVQILSATEILREIDALTFEQMQKVCEYVERVLKMPDTVMENRDVDAQLFHVLFTSLNGALSRGVLNTEVEDEPVYKTSPSEKRVKYERDWPILVQLYKDALGLKGDGSETERFIAYHKYVEEAFSQDLDEDDKEAIQSYLKTKSTMLLAENDGNAVAAINQMASQMREDLNLGFVISPHVLSFILNMFFKCDVLPLILLRVSP